MKKPTRPRATRATRATRPADVRLKAWTAGTLKREDWDFSPLADWPEDALRKAWDWELERELGSGHGPAIKAMKPPAKPAPPMLKSYWLGELAKDMSDGAAWIPSGTNDFTTIQAIEVDWTKSETELVEAFRNWLRDGQHPFHTSYETHTAFLAGPKRGKRKTAGFMAWLRELAIYRISEAGFTREKGLIRLGRFTAEGIVSPANWEHAQARTCEHIQKHLQGLESIARNMSRIDPARSSPDWREYFARL